MVKLNDLQKHELIDWSEEVENILRTLSEKAQIWRFLHVQNHNIFKRKYYCLIIPVTILSSITGAANLALGSISNGNETVINLVIGTIGIIISVISTLNNIFSFQKRKDEHYRASKDWYRVQRMIDIELSLQKSKRNNVNTFFHLVLQEIERIHEFHPNIRQDVIRKFMKKYKNKKLNIDIPEILSIKKTLIFNNNISQTTSKDEHNISSNMYSNIQDNKIISPETKNSNNIKNLPDIIKTNEIDNIVKNSDKTIVKNTIQTSSTKLMDNFHVPVIQTVVQNSKNKINNIDEIEISNSLNSLTGSLTNLSETVDEGVLHTVIDINDTSNESSKTSI
jgi:hypothetical protein